MHVKTTQTTTKLGTKTVKFKIHDLRGTNGFPQSQGGLVFEHHEERVIRDKYTGLPIQRDARYVIRTGSDVKGWRIDLLPKLGPPEAVYDLDPERTAYFPSNAEAAAALVRRLTEISDNSTAFSF